MIYCIIIKTSAKYQVCEMLQRLSGLICVDFGIKDKAEFAL